MKMTSTPVQDRETRTKAAQPQHLPSPEAQTKRNPLFVFLNSPYAVGAIIVSFLAILGIWNALDHRIPNHDPAWHAIWSSNVKRFIIHPRDWTLSNLIGLGKQHPIYPPGCWAFNGMLKVLFGDSMFADKACLMVQSLILAFSFYKLAMFSTASRVKANAGLICLLSFPLVCALQRVLYIDLYQLALFTAFLASMAAWNKSPNWKTAGLASFLMGIHVLSKQTAVLYAGPLLAVLFLYKLFYKKQWKEAAQLFLVGISGIIFLAAFWTIPNHMELMQYTAWRSPAATPFAAKALRILDNLAVSSTQILESTGPLFLLCAVPLALIKAGWNRIIKDNAAALFSTVLGWMLIIIIAWFNAPEPRYFSPVLVPLALVLGALIGGGLESASSWRRMLAASIPCLAMAQMLLLCFQPAPLIKQPKPLAVSPVYDAVGIKRDPFLRGFIGYDRAGDPWKQKWALDKIAAVEKYRYTWLNVLPSTTEFDQGSLIYLGERLKQKNRAFPVTWRSCNADMSDSFKYTENDFNSMDWFLAKTGNQGAQFTDENSKKAFAQALDRLQHSGDYILMASTPLPDKSTLQLYRKDYTVFWNRNARKKWFGEKVAASQAQHSNQPQESNLR